MPEPIPLGLTFRFAIVRAIVSASLVNTPLGGTVKTVLTFRPHCFFFGEAAIVIRENPMHNQCQRGCRARIQQWPQQAFVRPPAPWSPTACEEQAASSVRFFR